MSDPFLRDAFGAPCALPGPRAIGFSPEAEAVLQAYVAAQPIKQRHGAEQHLRHASLRAARSQQYPEVTITTLRAQISRHARTNDEGDNDQ